MPYADPLVQRQYLTKYARTWYWRNREKDLARQRKWRESNKEKLRAARKRFRQMNKERLALEQRIRRETNPERLALIDRRSAYKIKYGITIEDFNAMLIKQDNKCAICFSLKPGGRWARFAVDHCHSTGQVRGLLCAKCNSSLGWYEKHHSAITSYAMKR